MLLFHWFLIALDFSCPCQQLLEPVSVGLWSPACSVVPSAGLSSKSMSSSLCMGGVVEEGRAMVLPKRLRLSRDEPEDRVDTRLTGRSPSPSTGSKHGRLQHSGPESSFARSCLLLERGEDNWGDSERGRGKNNNTEGRSQEIVSNIFKSCKVNPLGYPSHSSRHQPSGNLSSPLVSHIMQNVL